MKQIKNLYYYNFLKWVLCFTLILLSIQKGITQQSTIDSLNLELNKEIHDSSKVLILLGMYNLTSYENAEEAEKYLDQALEMSRGINDKHYYFQALLEKGRYIVYNQMPLEQSLPILLEVLDVAKLLGDKKSIAIAIMDIADAYYYANQIDKAFLYYKDGLDYCREIGYSDYIMWNINALGVTLDFRGQSEEAFFYYEEGMKFAEQQKDTAWMAAFYNNIAEVYRERKDSENAILYYNKALDITQDIWDHCLVHVNLGQLYTAEKKFNLAKINLEKALDLAYTNDLEEELFNIQTRWGDYYLALGRKEKAFEEYNKVEQLIKKSRPFYEIGFMRYTSIDLFKSMATAFEITNEPELALVYHKKYLTIEDTLFGQEKKDLILSLDTKYKMEQKETENKLLKAEAEAYDTLLQKRTTITIAALLIALFIIALTFTFYNYSKRNKRYTLKLEKEVNDRIQDIRIANIDLEKSNSELESFASISSHDLKEPLRTIVGFTGFLESNLKKENYENISTAVGFIKTNVQKMFRLVEDILAYSSLEAKLDNDQFLAFEEVQSHVSSSLQTLIKEKEAQVIYDFDNEPVQQLLVSPKLKIVFKNIIENGLKYNTNEPPKVWINYCNKQEGFNLFSITDNGIGIKQSYHETIFQMFKRLHTKEEYPGTGIGLAICKKIVENLGGALTLKKSDKNGSEFVISIPKEIKENHDQQF